MAAIALSAKVTQRQGVGRLILRVTTDATKPSKDSALLLRGEQTVDCEGFGLVLSVEQSQAGAVELPLSYDYLADGDIVRYVGKTGDLRVLYRKSSRHNVLFLTEQCNSRCVMCSQPPRDIDDSYLIEDIVQSIPMMASTTPQLCITGGEPTLRFEGLLKIINLVKELLPQTHLHMLSNGRVFQNRCLASKVTAIKHPDFVIGIPLYSNQPSHHDFVVQSKGAFDETVQGILNLAAYQQRIEIRFVIHRLTVSRMVATARFIARNFPFASHVALMGFEPTGFGRTNLESLWIDPWDYREELEEAIEILKSARMRVSIYNHQLCVLPPSLWSFAAQSISDWKNIYLDKCSGCSVRDRCAGFFSSNHHAASRHINAL